MFNVDELPKGTAVCSIAERRRARVAKFGYPPGQFPTCNIYRRGSMQDILTCVMGLDVHQDSIIACRAKGDIRSELEMEIRSFSTLIPKLKKLQD